MEAALQGPGGRIVLGPTVLTIGRRSDNQLVVSDAQASNRHAEIRPSGQDYVITDLASTNGTFVNEQRLDSNVPRFLTRNDRIRIGDSIFTYEVSTPSEGVLSYVTPGQPGRSTSAPTAASDFTGYGGGAQQAYSPSTVPYGPYSDVSPPSPQPTTPPPAPAPQRRGNRMLLLSVVPLLVLILVLGGVLAFVLHSQAPGNSPQTSTVPTLSASQLTATAQANMTATASVIAANQNPYASGGTLVMLDPLTDNSRGFGWAQGTASDNSGGCTFTTAGYQVNANKTQYSYYCSATNTYTNFTFEAQVQIIKGDCGGLMFRANTTTGKFYLFEVCTDGSYDLSTDSNVLAKASSPAIKAGVNQSNVLAVTAQGSTLTLYANGQKLTSVTNNSYTQGQVALVADSYNNITGVLFSKARLWTISGSGLDTSIYYRLTNAFLGPGQSLDVRSDGSHLLKMAPTGNYTGQFWKLVPLGGGKYALRTAYLGDGFSLDVINDGVDTTPKMMATGNYSGQSWSVVPWGDGTYKLTNDFTGPDKALDTYSDTHEPFLGPGGHTGQHWTLTPLGPSA